MATLRIEIQLSDNSTGANITDELGRVADYLDDVIHEKKVTTAFGSAVIFEEDIATGQRIYEAWVDYDAELPSKVAA